MVWFNPCGSPLHPGRSAGALLNLFCAQSCAHDSRGPWIPWRQALPAAFAGRLRRRTAIPGDRPQWRRGPLRLLAVAAGVVQSLRPPWCRGRPGIRTMVTAVCAATTGVTTTAIPDVPWRVGRWIVPVGLGLAVARGAVHVGAAADVVPGVGSSPAERGGCGGGGHCRRGCAGRCPGLAARTARWAGSALAHRRGGSPTAWAGLLVLAAGTSLAGVAAVGVRAGLSGLRAVGTAADPASGRRPTTLTSPGGFCGRLRHAGPRRPSVRESADPCRADPGSLRAVGRTCPRLHRAVHSAHCGTAGGPRAPPNERLGVWNARPCSS